MARSLIKGKQLKDESIGISKLAPEIYARLLKNSMPIARVKLSKSFLAHTDFVLPNGLTYSTDVFTERVAVYRNGQLLFSGNSPPIDKNDPTEVYPGSNEMAIKFDMDLRRGETIQIIIL